MQAKVPEKAANIDLYRQICLIINSWAIKMTTRLFTALLVLLVHSMALAQTQQETLFQRALQGTKCEQIPNNGRYCKYQFDGVLEIGIKDVGGTDTVVGFHNSNIKRTLCSPLLWLHSNRPWRSSFEKLWPRLWCFHLSKNRAGLPIDG